MEREKYRSEISAVIAKADETSNDARKITDQAANIRQRMKQDLSAKEDQLKKLENAITEIKEKAKVN